MGVIRKTQGVSLDPEILEKGKLRAESLKINFSAYIHHLIQRDLKELGPLIIEADPEEDKKLRKSLK